MGGMEVGALVILSPYSPSPMYVNMYSIDCDCVTQSQMEYGVI